MVFVNAIDTDHFASHLQQIAPLKCPEGGEFLTIEQIASIPNAWWLGQMSDAARALLTWQQTRALRQGALQNLGLLTPLQVASLTQDRVRSLHYEDFQYLHRHQATSLSLEQIAKSSRNDPVVFGKALVVVLFNTATTTITIVSLHSVRLS